VHLPRLPLFTPASLLLPLFQAGNPGFKACGNQRTMHEHFCSSFGGQVRPFVLMALIN
jgi:hypothetical protein